MMGGFFLIRKDRSAFRPLSYPCLTQYEQHSDGRVVFALVFIHSLSLLVAIYLNIHHGEGHLCEN